MKKILAVLFLAATMVFGAFAQDATDIKVEFPSGSWIDSNWNAEWVISADMHVTLKDATTGEIIYDFKDDKIADKALDFNTTDGVILKFTCAETERKYYFSKPVTLSTSLFLEIDPEWTTENYKVEIYVKE